MFRQILVLSAVCFYLFLPQESVQEDALPAGADGQRIEKIREYLREAGTLFNESRFTEAGKPLKAAQSLMARSIENGTEEFRAVIEKEYRRIAKAHELLTEKGIELPELIAFPEKLGVAAEEMEKEKEMMDDGEDKVSFISDVIPILTENCGTCHINGSRGRLSIKTYNQMIAQRRGKLVIPNDAKESLMIEQVVSGDMPPRGKLKDSEIETLRKWVEQGAKFDGEESDQEEPLGSLSKNP